MFWRRGEGIGSREQVVAWLDVTSGENIFRGERAEAGEAIEKDESQRRCFLDGHGSK